MRLKNILFEAAFIGLLGISNSAFSQEEIEQSQNLNKMQPGVEIGKIMNKNTTGMTVGLYFYNPKIQIGYVAEINRKSKPMSPGKGIDLLKCGVEFEYFPTNMKVIRPYIGSEIKYEGESLFVGKENEYYTKNGIGLEMKVGTEIKPLRNRKIRGYLDLGYNFSFAKKSTGYPKNPEVVRDKFLIVAGIKF